MALDRGPRQSLKCGGDLVRETLPGAVGEGALMEIFALIGKPAPKEMLMDRPGSSARISNGGPFRMTAIIRHQATPM
jgi:hypothetical protein